MTGGNNGPTWSAVANWTRTWTTNLVGDNRFSYSLIGIDDTINDWSGLLGADGNSKFGIPGGFDYVPDCKAVDRHNGSDAHCGTSFGDSSSDGGGAGDAGGFGGSESTGSGDGGSGGGDSSGGCGGGCGGGGGD